MTREETAPETTTTTSLSPEEERLRFTEASQFQAREENNIAAQVEETTSSSPPRPQLSIQFAEGISPEDQIEALRQIDRLTDHEVLYTGNMAGIRNTWSSIVSGGGRRNNSNTNTAASDNIIEGRAPIGENTNPSAALTEEVERLRQENARLRATRDATAASLAQQMEGDAAGAAAGGNNDTAVASSTENTAVPAGHVEPVIPGATSRQYVTENRDRIAAFMNQNEAQRAETVERLEEGLERQRQLAEERAVAINEAQARFARAEIETMLARSEAQAAARREAAAAREEAAAARREAVAARRDAAAARAAGRRLISTAALALSDHPDTTINEGPPELVTAHVRPPPPRNPPPAPGSHPNALPPLQARRGVRPGTEWDTDSDSSDGSIPGLVERDVDVLDNPLVIDFEEDSDEVRRLFENAPPPRRPQAEDFVSDGDSSDSREMPGLAPDSSSEEEDAGERRGNAQVPTRTLQELRRRQQQRLTERPRSATPPGMPGLAIGADSSSSSDDESDMPELVSREMMARESDDDSDDEAFQSGIDAATRRIFESMPAGIPGGYSSTNMNRMMEEAMASLFGNSFQDSERMRMKKRTVKCPVCSEPFLDYEESEHPHRKAARKSANHCCSHGATMLFIKLESCPICMEDDIEPPVVALSCGHVICSHDFERLGGMVGPRPADKPAPMKLPKKDGDSATGTATSTARVSDSPAIRAFSRMHMPHMFGPRSTLTSSTGNRPQFSLPTPPDGSESDTDDEMPALVTRDGTIVDSDNDGPPPLMQRPRLRADSDSSASSNNMPDLVGRTQMGGSSDEDTSDEDVRMPGLAGRIDDDSDDESDAPPPLMTRRRARFYDSDESETTSEDESMPGLVERQADIADSSDDDDGFLPVQTRRGTRRNASAPAASTSTSSQRNTSTSAPAPASSTLPAPASAAAAAGRRAPSTFRDALLRRAGVAQRSSTSNATASNSTSARSIATQGDERPAATTTATAPRTAPRSSQVPTNDPTVPSSTMSYFQAYAAQIQTDDSSSEEDGTSNIQTID